MLFWLISRFFFYFHSLEVYLFLLPLKRELERFTPSANTAIIAAFLPSLLVSLLCMVSRGFFYIVKISLRIWTFLAWLLRITGLCTVANEHTRAQSIKQLLGQSKPKFCPWPLLSNSWACGHVQSFYPEPVFGNLLRTQGIDSQPGGIDSWAPLRVSQI